jgi:multidrug resistance protein, MATE family
MNHQFELFCVIAAVLLLFLPFSQRFALRAGSSRLEIKAEVSALLGIAIPLTVVRVAQALNSTVDTAVAGRLSPEELAGTAFGALVFSTLSGALTPVLSSTNVHIARQRSEGRFDDAWTSLVQSLWASLLLSALCIGIVVTIQVSNVTQGFAGAYLSGVLPGIPAIFAFASIRYSLSALARQRFMLFVSLASLVINIIADVVFAFGYGMPRLGVFGIGLSTSVTHWVTVVALLIYLGYFDAETRVQRSSRGWVISASIVRQIFVEGWSIGAVALVETGFFALIGWMMGGQQALAAHQIASDIVYVIFMFSSCLGQAVAVQLAVTSSRLTVNVTIAMCIVYTLLVNALLQTSPAAFVGLFVNLDDARFATVRDQAIVLVRMGGVFCLFDALQITLTGMLRAFEDNVIALGITSASYWIVGCGSGYLLSLVFGFVGVWTGIIVGLGLASVLLFVRVQHKLND